MRTFHKVQMVIQNMSLSGTSKASGRSLRGISMSGYDRVSAIATVARLGRAQRDSRFALLPFRQGDLYREVRGFPMRVPTSGARMSAQSADELFDRPFERSRSIPSDLRLSSGLHPCKGRVLFKRSENRSGVAAQMCSRRGGAQAAFFGGSKDESFESGPLFRSMDHDRWETVFKGNF